MKNKHKEWHPAIKPLKLFATLLNNKISIKFYVFDNRTIFLKLFSHIS
jgi:hypothetical protein